MKTNSKMILLVYTLKNSRISTSRELMTFDDTEVKTDEQNIAMTFPSEIKLEIR